MFAIELKKIRLICNPFLVRKMRKLIIQGVEVFDKTYLFLLLSFVLIFASYSHILISLGIVINTSGWFNLAEV